MSSSPTTIVLSQEAPADLHLLKAEEVNSSLLRPADQVAAGSLHEYDGFDRVLLVLDALQHQLHLVNDVTHDGLQ